MPSVSSILNLGAQALIAAQNGINVTSNNISNAATEGYTRQRAVVEPNTPTYYPYGAIGSGVSMRDVERIRDVYSDRTFRRESGGAGFADGRFQLLSRVETLFNEPGELGLSSQIDTFLNRWSQLATNPTDSTVRSLVRQSGEELAGGFQRINGQLDQIRQEGEVRLAEAVDRINALSEEISRLNQEIIAIEATGISAPELRDSRDRAVDEMSGLAGVETHERDDGSIGVTLQGYTISDRDTFTRIEIRTSAGNVGVGIEGRTGFVPDVGGRVGGLLAGLNEDVAGTRARLDELAAAIVAEVNAVHSTGTSPNGSTGIDFFDPSGTTAAAFALSADIRADLDNLAAGTPDGSGQYRAGVNDVALGIAGLRDNPAAALGAPISESYRGLVSDLGMTLRSSQDAGQVARTLADNAASRRESLGGVSTDEELVKLIQYQSAYQAAARVITTADELLETLLAI